MDVHTANKALIAPLRAAMYDFTETGVRTVLDAVMAADAVCHFAHPMGDMTGPGALYDTCYAPLLAAVPDLERRDYIVMAGPTDQGDHWVGCGGYYTGVFIAPWLDIPPTGHLVHMRFHEFYRIQGGKVVEVQAIWDIPEVMMQARAWPMAPSLGREWHVPGPATQDGLVPGPFDPAQAADSCAHIVEMLGYMKKHPSQGGPDVMQMDRFWHPRMTWYGPSGIGTGRGMGSTHLISRGPGSLSIATLPTSASIRFWVRPRTLPPSSATCALMTRSMAANTLSSRPAARSPICEGADAAS